MSILRRTAQKISAKVVSYSSAGNKEWAEGLAREVDFIQSDWGALLWSLGSMRVLLDRRPAPICTYDDLQLVLEKFVKAKRIGNSYWVVGIFQAATHLADSYSSNLTSRRVGLIILAAFWIITGIYSYLEDRASKRAVRGKDPCDLIGYYKSQLLKRAGYFHSTRWWVNLGVLVPLYFTGETLAFPGHLRFALITSAAILASIAIICMYDTRSARRRLQELDALLESKS